MNDEELDNAYWVAENRKVDLAWQQAMKRADERLAQANRDGTEDSWYEEDEPDE